MLKLLQILLDIALVRRGPQDLPRSWLLFYVTLALWVGASLLTMSILSEATFAAFGRSFAGWLASLALFAAIVSIAGYPGRILQTLSAIAGAGAVIVLGQIFADLVSIMLNGSSNQLAREALLFWAIFVKGYILAAAINVKALIGVLLSLAIFVARFAVSHSLSVS